MHTIVKRDGWVALIAAVALVLGFVVGPAPLQAPSLNAPAAFNSLLME